MGRLLGHRRRAGRRSSADYTAERIRRARPPAPLDPGRADPLEPPPNPVNAPAFAYYFADVNHRRGLRAEGLGRETWLSTRDDDWEEVAERHAGIYDDDEAIPATDVWRVDLSAARFRFDIDRVHVVLLQKLDGSALTRVKTLPGRSAPGTAGGLVDIATGAVATTIRCVASVAGRWARRSGP